MQQLYLMFPCLGRIHFLILYYYHDGNLHSLLSIYIMQLNLYSHITIVFICWLGIYFYLYGHIELRRLYEKCCLCHVLWPLEPASQYSLYFPIFCLSRPLYSSSGKTIFVKNECVFSLYFDLPLYFSWRPTVLVRSTVEISLNH